MDQSQVEQILRNPKFQKWSRQKCIKLDPHHHHVNSLRGLYATCRLQQRILMSSFSGGVTTWGIPLGIGIIILSFVLCGVYSYIANNTLDQLSEEALKEVEAITHEKGLH